LRSDGTPGLRPDFRNVARLADRPKSTSFADKPVAAGVAKLH
jgi:hypothetical protein